MVDLRNFSTPASFAPTSYVSNSLKKLQQRVDALEQEKKDLRNFLEEKSYRNTLTIYIEKKTTRKIESINKKIDELTHKIHCNDFNQFN